MKFSSFLANLAIVTATATVVSAQANPGDWQFGECHDSSYGPLDMNVTSWQLGPDFCPGKNVTVNWSGNLIAPITAPATLSLWGRVASYPSQKIRINVTMDFCQMLAESGVPCPVAANTVLPSLTIPLHPFNEAEQPWRIMIKATNGNGHQIFCQSTLAYVRKCSQPI